MFFDSPLFVSFVYPDRHTTVNREFSGRSKCSSSDGVPGDIETHSNEKVSKVHDEFEKRLSDMQSEFRKLTAAKKEHTRLLRNQTNVETQFKTLQHELADMKKQKVGWPIQSILRSSS